MSKNRNKLLYGLLAIVVTAFALDTGARKFYDEPHAQREARLRRIQKELEDNRRKIGDAKKAPELLHDFDQRSLPSNLELARASYQNWLLELIQQSSLQQPKVDAGSPSPRRNGRQLAYFAIGFSITGRGDLSQITRLLHDFYSTNHLHKIRSLSLVPIAGTDLVEMSLAIEALVLPTATHTDTLGSSPASRLAFSDPREYQPIAHRNLFSASASARQNYRWLLTAITFDIQGSGEAWITDTTNGETHRFKSGDTLRLGNLDTKITNITNTHITIESTAQKIPVGHTLPPT